jgi:moderate conductance mechanosensitive channel
MRLAPEADPSTGSGTSASRLRTLLPLLRGCLLATICVTAALIALAEFGVQIGPLLAGAGVVGIAVGFGAQTLVRDVISGAFYLMDDAFRLGSTSTSATRRAPSRRSGFAPCSSGTSAAR